MHSPRAVGFTGVLSAFPSTCPATPLPDPHLATSVGSYRHRSHFLQCQAVLVLVPRGKGEKGLQEGPAKSRAAREKGTSKKGDPDLFRQSPFILGGRFPKGNTKYLISFGRLEGANDHLHAGTFLTCSHLSPHINSMKFLLSPSFYRQDEAQR